MKRDFMQSWARIKALIIKEFIIIWKDPRMRAIIIMLPILQLLVFANCITMEIKNIDVSLIDRDNSLESRELIAHLQSSPRFRRIIFLQDEKELIKNIDTQKTQIGIFINNNFSDSIKARRAVEILVIADGRQTSSATLAGNYVSQIVAEYNAQVVAKILGSSGAGVEAALAGVGDSKGLSVSVRNWFNPNIEYKWYILTILLAMLAMVLVLVLTAMSIARERELGTFDQLIVSPLSSNEILIGKTIPPLIISTSITMFMALLVNLIFGVPFSGSVVLFFVSIVIALLSLVGVGLFISSISKTQQQALLGVITFQVPALLLSGFISPIEDMPEILQILTYANPVRFFMVLTKGIYLKGMDVQQVFVNFIPLIVLAVITLALASLTFKKKME